MEEERSRPARPSLPTVICFSEPVEVGVVVDAPEASGIADKNSLEVGDHPLASPDRACVPSIDRPELKRKKSVKIKWIRIRCFFTWFGHFH